MTYSGHIENGSVILDEPVTLPEGARVEVRLTQPDSPKSPTQETLADKLLRHAGTAVDLPEDAAEQHDHYLYATPKR